MRTGNVLIGATKAPRESDINFRVGSMVYSSRNKQSGIVVTKKEYGYKMLNNAQTPVYFPKSKKVVAVYNRYLVSLDDKGLGSLSSGKKGCLTKEFRKLYVPSKRSMSREQKVAIALNKCNIPYSK